MRRIVRLLGVAVLLVGAFAIPAWAEGIPAFEYKSADNTASATFREDTRTVTVYMTETEREDDRYDSFWVRVAVSDYGDDFVFCNGVVDISGIDGFYFRANGAHVDAVLPFYCSDGRGPFDVHVNATWSTHGSPSISNTVENGIDDMTEAPFTRELQYVVPTVTDAEVTLSVSLVEIPAFDRGEISMRTLHGVYTQPEGLP